MLFSSTTCLIFLELGSYLFLDIQNIHWELIFQDAESNGILLQRLLYFFLFFILNSVKSTECTQIVALQVFLVVLWGVAVLKVGSILSHRFFSLLFFPFFEKCFLSVQNSELH